MRKPTFQLERELVSQGYRGVVGVDEVGCGSLAGPVVSAAVIFPLDSRLGAVHDSKLLRPAVREKLYNCIRKKARAWSIGKASVQEIMELGVREAGLLACRRAVLQIATAEIVLMDAWHIPGLALPQRSVVRGDRLVKSIAAASILAKVTRDRMMCQLAEQFPVYGFEKHKGYATAHHLRMIKEHGHCRAHRLTWRPFVDIISAAQKTSCV